MCALAIMRKLLSIISEFLGRWSLLLSRPALERLFLQFLISEHWVTPHAVVMEPTALPASGCVWSAQCIECTFGGRQDQQLPAALFPCLVLGVCM